MNSTTVRCMHRFDTLPSQFDPNNLTLRLRRLLPLPSTLFFSISFSFFRSFTPMPTIHVSHLSDQNCSRPGAHSFVLNSCRTRLGCGDACICCCFVLLSSCARTHEAQMYWHSRVWCADNVRTKPKIHSNFVVRISFRECAPTHSLNNCSYILSFSREVTRKRRRKKPRTYKIGFYVFAFFFLRSIFNGIVDVRLRTTYVRQRIQLRTLFLVSVLLFWL